MSAKKRGLGRGLDALLGIGANGRPAEAATQAEFQKLPIDLIQRGRYQPRLDIKAETLQELASSIKARGVIQPIVVRPLPDGKRFELIAGERRWRATQIAGLHEIPAIVRQVPDEVAMSVALIENIQREDLNPLEEAAGFSRLINEFEMTHQQVATAVGRSRAAVSNLLRLLDLDDEVKRMLEVGDIEMGHARALLALQGNDQRNVGNQVVSQGLSVRETERLIKRWRADAKAERKAPERPRDPNISKLEQELAEQLGARVNLSHTSKGKGSLTIRYNSLDELDGILAHIK